MEGLINELNDEEKTVRSALHWWRSADYKLKLLIISISKAKNRKFAHFFLSKGMCCV